MSRTAYDHEDFKLNEQQEAVLNRMRRREMYNDGSDWATSYDLTGKLEPVGDKMVKIGDAGRRMRELREAGILESRKRGRFEEYKIVDRPKPTGMLF